MNEVLVRNIVPITIRCLHVKKGTSHTFQDKFTNMKPNFRLRILNSHLKLVIFIENVRDIYIRLFCCHFSLKILVLKIPHYFFTIWKSVTQIIIWWYIYTLRKWEAVLNHEKIYQNKKQNKSQWSKNKSFKSYKVLIIYNVSDSHRSVSLVLYLICVFTGMTNWRQHRVNLCMVDMDVVSNINFSIEVLWLNNAK